MKLIDSSWEIDHYEPEEDMRRITRGARLCYQSKPLETFEEQCRFISSMRKRDLDNPHETPLEHSSLSVVFITNRGSTHELVRHRIASPNEQSTRYCNYLNGKRFDGNVVFIRDPHFEGDMEMFMRHCKRCEDDYFERLRHGYSVDEARGALNNDAKSEIMITANFREWRHILRLRSSEKAHYQVQELFQPLKEFLKADLPCVFGDLP